jgi:hypothetical protein
MKKIAFIIATAFLTLPGLLAQNVNDALRYSQVFYTGTARFMSMGGAFTALGGDMSTLSQNPAGLGVFRSSEISFSPQLFHFSTSANFHGITKDYLYNFNLGQAGIVSNLISGSGQSGLISLNIGYSFNKTSNLNSSITIQGISNTSSMADSWADQSYGYYKDELFDFAPYGYMANQVLLIDTLPNSDLEYGTVFSDYGENSHSVYGQNLRRLISTEGYTGEHAFSVGGNYSNKIFFGATLGINRLKYTEHYEHLESVDYALAYGLQNFTYTKHTENTGTGISLKIGAIIKPVESIRIGLAFHSPTYYRINSYLYDDIVANFKGYNPDEFSLDPLRYNYALTTPFRALAGIAYQYKKSALLSFDYEFIDYSTARFSETGDNYDYGEKNLDIKNTLKPASNFRLGGEYRIDKIYLRGGYGYYGKSFIADDQNGNMYHRSISFGAGFREQNLNIDFGYTNMSNSQRYELYSIYSETAANNLEPVIADFNTAKNIFTVTIGYKFGY